MTNDTCCAISHCTSEDQAKIKKTVLFVPLDSIGHINALKCIANSLKKRGHRTVFLFQDPLDGGLKEAGHEVYDCTNDELVESVIEEQKELKWQAVLDQMMKLWRNPTAENLEAGIRLGWTAMSKGIIEKDAIFARKLELIKPDVFIIDHYYMQPAVIKYGKPWSLVYSASPLGLHPRENNLPPAFLGFPTNYREHENLDKRSFYLDLQKRIRSIKEDLHQKWSKYLHDEHGLPPCSNNPLSFIHLSEKLNVYMYPKELDYGKPLPDWTQCDSMLRINSYECQQQSTSNKAAGFKMPEKLAGKQGKLIFLSMGTLVSGDVGLMKNLVEILSKSPHKFIISMGQNWDKYELADNMWGEKYVDQLALLPHIDMIITHGGNNTITECFYYGVPGFIVCPAYGDQKDNAQRVEECKLGKRIDPFNCNSDELLSSIEEILADVSIKPRMKAISERMQQPENKFKAIRLFRKFVEDS